MVESPMGGILVVQVKIYVNISVCPTSLHLPPAPTKKLTGCLLST